MADCAVKLCSERVDRSLNGTQTQMLRIRRIGRKGMWLRRPLRGLRHNAFSSGLSVRYAPGFREGRACPVRNHEGLAIATGKQTKSMKVKSDDEDDSNV